MREVPSFPHFLPPAAGPASPGLCGAPTAPPTGQPGVGRWPCIKLTPGNTKPWWEELDLPLTVLKPPGFPARCGHYSGEGGHLARRDLCLAHPGKPAVPPAQWPLQPWPPPSVISPP
jgi:hypothetical protein